MQLGGSYKFYGLECKEKDTLCEHINNKERKCDRKVCLHDDNSWLYQQEKIKKTIIENAMLKKQEMAIESADPPAPIRRQNKTGKQLLEEKAERLEVKARHLYKANKPKAADCIMRDVMVIRGRLRNMKGM